MKRIEKHIINRKKGMRNNLYVITFMLIQLTIISSLLLAGKANGEGEDFVGQDGFYITVEGRPKHIFIEYGMSNFQAVDTIDIRQPVYLTRIITDL